MADDTTWVMAPEPAQIPPKESRRLNADDIAEPEVPHEPASGSMRPQSLPGRRPLFRN
jgi:hypothetical protein